MDGSVTEWDCVKETMDAYCAEVRKLEGHFEGIKFQHVTRDHNVAADVLSKLGSRRAQVPTGVFVQDLRKPSIKMLEAYASDEPKALVLHADVLVVEKEDDWQEQFIAFLVHQRAPEDKTEREKVARRSANYVVISDELYRRAASTGVLMKCILQSEGLRLLAEIHGGECGNHVASANLVGKVYRSGFY